MLVFQAMVRDPLSQAVLCLDEIHDMTCEFLEAQAFCLPAFEGKTLVAKLCLVGSTAAEVEQHIDLGEADEL